MSGKKHIANETDIAIGRAIVRLRNQYGMSQKHLAAQTGVTFQQIQKYETAGNRISASKMYDIARVFGVPVATLYNEADQQYTHDTDVCEIIQCLYKMPPAERKLIHSLTVMLINKKKIATQKKSSRQRLSADKKTRLKKPTKKQSADNKRKK